MLVRGGVSGAQRIARHLWCMCFALFFRHRLLFPGTATSIPPLCPVLVQCSQLQCVACKAGLVHDAESGSSQFTCGGPLCLIVGSDIVSRRDDQADSCVWLSIYS